MTRTYGTPTVCDAIDAFFNDFPFNSNMSVNRAVNSISKRARPALEFVREMSTAKSFPYYDLIQTDDKTWEIRIALAGYSKDEIEILSLNNYVTIKTKSQSVGGEDIKTSSELEKTKEAFPKTIYQGISKVDFERTWVLPAENSKLEVESAIWKDGILTIIVHDATLIGKPKVIEIKSIKEK